MRKVSRAPRAPSRSRSTPRPRRKSRWHALGDVLRLGAALTAFGAALTVDLDPPANGNVFGWRAPVEHASATAAPIAAVWSYDMDGDGAADFSNPTHSHIRDHDAYGDGCFGASRDGGRRKHQGADYVALPGDIVRAPITGEVTQIGTAYGRNSGLRFVELRDPKTQVRARVFYVSPEIRRGDFVIAGDAIGQAQDLSRRYPNGITNHVHVELRAAGGQHIDPELLLPNAPIRLAALPARTSLR